MGSARAATCFTPEPIGARRLLPELMAGVGCGAVVPIRDPDTVRGITFDGETITGANGFEVSPE